MEIWVVNAVSCRECNIQSVGVFDHAPEEKEVEEVKAVCEKLRCLSVHIQHLKLNEISDRFPLDE